MELLAPPRPSDRLPENPVGKTLGRCAAVYADFTEQGLGGRDLAEPETIGKRGDVRRSDRAASNERRTNSARYDLTLPLLLSRCVTKRNPHFGSGLRARLTVPASDAMHLGSFPAEVLWLVERAQLDSWQMTGRVLQSVDRLFPSRTFKIVPTQCPDVQSVVGDRGRRRRAMVSVLAWGVFTDRIVRHLGGDPERHIAVGVGYGLERLAMLRTASTISDGSRLPAWRDLVGVPCSDNLERSVRSRRREGFPAPRLTAMPSKRRYRAGFSEYSVRCRTSTRGRLTLISIVRRRLDGSVLVE